MPITTHAFYDLIVAIDNKIGTSPPSTPEAREAHIFYNKDIIKNMASAARHPYFEYVVTSQCKHEEFKAYWCQLEAVFSRIQEDDRYEANNWETESKELTEIVAEIRHAHPTVCKWTDYNRPDSEGPDSQIHIQSGADGQNSVKSHKNTSSGRYSDGGSWALRGTPYMDDDSDEEFILPWQRPGR